MNKLISQTTKVDHLVVIEEVKDSVRGRSGLTEHSIVITTEYNYDYRQWVAKLELSGYGDNQEEALRDIITQCSAIGKTTLEIK